MTERFVDCLEDTMFVSAELDNLALVYSNWQRIGGINASSVCLTLNNGQTLVRTSNLPYRITFPEGEQITFFTQLDANAPELLPGDIGFSAEFAYCGLILLFANNNIYPIHQTPNDRYFRKGVENGLLNKEVSHAIVIARAPSEYVTLLNYYYPMINPQVFVFDEMLNDEFVFFNAWIKNEDGKAKIKIDY